MDKYLMAIDAGTGSVRAVIFDLNGNQISVGQREWTHLSVAGVENSMGFDCVKNWELTKECISEALSSGSINPSDILAVSSSSMREGIVLYDKDGTELWAVANVDSRAAKEVKYLKEHFEGIEEEFYNLSGQTFALGAIPRVMWVKNNLPDIYEKVAKISMISDWILYKLSGVISSDPSNAGTAGIFSLDSRDWVASMCTKVGIKDDIFPQCVEVGTVIGDITADDCELDSNTVVVQGGGDVQLGSAGLGIVEDGQVAILGGSFWQQVVNIKSDVTPPSNIDIRVNPHVVPQLSQAEGITFFSGLVMRWFRDSFCDIEKIEAKEQGVDVYTIMEQKASKIPIGSNGIIPIFSDSMKYGKWYHAAPSFLNLNIDPEVCNKASMFRSLQENACIVSDINLKKIEAFSGVKTDTIVFASGASKGELWCQILADVTGCKIKIPKVTEATALGCAMAAGVGAKVYDDLKSAANRLVVWDRVYTPNMQNHQTYKSIKENWQKAYDTQLQLVDENITTSMWKAPGI
jgi:autoinducer 2 (AI-2) kinase